MRWSYVLIATGAGIMSLDAFMVGGTISDLSSGQRTWLGGGEATIYLAALSWLIGADLILRGVLRLRKAVKSAGAPPDGKQQDG